jgi:hypothetical protein
VHRADPTTFSAPNVIRVQGHAPRADTGNPR